MKRTLALRSFLLGSSLLAASSMAHAADVTWDITPGTVGAGNSTITGGTGAWNTTNGNWTTNGGVNNLAWVNANNDTAIFGDVAGTVTLGTGITVGGLAFNTAGYTVAGSTLTFGTPGNITTNVDATISSILAGSAITKLGTGTLTLQGQNTYSGLTVKAGMVQISTISTSVNAMGNGTVTIGDAANTGASAELRFNGGGIGFPAFSNAISVTGNGTATLSATSWVPTLNGAITLSNSLSVVSNNINGSAINITGGITGTGNLVIQGNAGAGQVGGSTITFSGTTLNFNGSITNSGTTLSTTLSNTVISAVIGSSVTSVTQNSANSSLTLSNANTYSGATLIKRGTLALGGGNDRLPTGTTVTLGDSVANTNGILKLDSRSQQIAGLLTAGSGTGNRVVNGNAAAATLTLNIASGTNTFGGILGGTGNENNFALSKIGAGTLTLSNANTFSGGLTIKAGMVQISTTTAVNAMGSGTVTIGDAANTGAAAELRFDGGGAFPTYTNAISVTGNGAATLSAVNFAPTFNGAITLSNSLSVVSNNVNGSNISFTGGITGTGNLVIQSNAANLSPANSQITFSGTTLNFTGSITNSGTTSNTTANSNTTISAVIGSSVTSVTQNSANSSLILSSANTYSGTTTIKAGTLALGTSGTFANSATIVVGDAGSSGAILNLTAKSSFAFGSGQTVKGIGTINIGAGKTITINGTLAKGNSIGTQTYTGNLALAGNDQIELGNSTGAGTYASPFNSDLGNVSGNLTLGGTLNVINNAGADSNGSISAGSYKIYTYGGTASGSYSGITNATGYRADIVNNGAGTGSGQGIYLDNYRVAAAASTQTVTLHTRTGVAVSTSLSLTNANNSTAPYQENLGTTGFSGTTSGYTATGSATGIAGGGTGSGSLTVGVNAGTVATAGTYSGSTTLGLQTEEVNASGLGNAGVGNQTVTINVNAYDFATAAFSQTAGDGSLTGGGLSYTLDFGTGLALNTNYTATLQLANGMFSLYKDSLQGTYSTVGGAFSETAANFASLTSGGTNTFTVSFFTSSTGTFTDTLTFNGTSLNTPLGNSALGQINIGVTAAAIPEPNVTALLGGLGLLALLRRRR